MSDERFYSFALVTYAKPVEFSLLLNSSLHYAYILHDKDNCESHYHILCTFTQHKSINKVKSYIESDSNTFVEPMRDKGSCYLYLTHDRETEKALYSEDEVITDSREFWTSCVPDKTLTNKEFINDLISLSAYQMAIKYGRDFMRNLDRYNYFKDYILNETQEKR